MRLRLDVDRVRCGKHQCFSLYLRLVNAPTMVSSMPLNAMPRAVAVLVQSVRIVAENHFLRDGISGKEPAGISPAALLQTKKGPRKPASPGALPSYLI